MWFLRWVQTSNLKSQSSILGHVAALLGCNVCNQVLCFASYWLHFKPVWSIGHLAMCHMVTRCTVTVNEDLLLWKMNMAAHLCWKAAHIFIFELTSAQNLADVSFTMNSYQDSFNVSVFQWYNSEKVNWPQNTKRQKPFKVPQGSLIEYWWSITILKRSVAIYWNSFCFLSLVDMKVPNDLVIIAV